MKDFVKATLVLGAMLALVLSARVAAFGYLHSEATAVKEPTAIAAADGGCAARHVKMPCLRHANPESPATLGMPARSGATGAADPETVVTRDTRCAVRQVKMPCFQHTELRS